MCACVVQRSVDVLRNKDFLVAKRIFIIKTALGIFYGYRKTFYVAPTRCKQAPSPNARCVSVSNSHAGL